jgi:predicted lipid-binding transport protein (Tim44 family)
MGQQSSNVTQREAAPSAPPRPQERTNAARSHRQRRATPAAAPKKPWGAMLGGLAAGLGLAWLASSLGLGEGFGQFLLIALLAWWSWW